MYEAVPQQPVFRPAASDHLALGVGADGTYTLGGQVAAFLLGVLTMLLFFPLIVVAALLYTRAEERFASGEVERGRRLVTWSWVCITPLPALALVVGSLAAVVALVG
ncbi:hypothetical protein [Actinomadura terrae]|uniref:hypothetical protein n=1 Tax=Actinomadura terrae TaxID=604353 RepID=UPI001FA7DADC|nr:hypothetical protein [Actinomadura terrae]